MSAEANLVAFYHLDIPFRELEVNSDGKKLRSKKQLQQIIESTSNQILTDSTVASEYDISSFCFYVEAHAGAEVAIASIQKATASPSYDIDFCVCWVNQVWLRSYQHLTQSPNYKYQDHKEFITALLPSLRHPRYQKINDKPLVVIYNLSMLENILQVTDDWRQYCADQGFGNIHIAAIEQQEKINLHNTGVDSFIEFPLNRYGLKNHPRLNVEDDDEIQFQAILYDYEQMVVQSLTRPQLPYPMHRGVLVGWDDSVLKGRSGFCFKNTTVANYKAWLHGLLKQLADESHGKPLLFIHAWNDHYNQSALVPNNTHDYEYLDATQQALRGTIDWRMLVDYAKKQGKLEGLLLDRFLKDLIDCFESQDKAIHYQSKVQRIKQQYFIQRVVFSEKVPDQLKLGTIMPDGEGYLDKVNTRNPAALREICVEKDALIRLQGWAVLEGAILDARTNSYFVLEGVNKQHYFAFVHGRQFREDVSDSKPLVPKGETLYSGFSFHADVSKLPTGLYRLGITQERRGEQCITFFDKVFNLV